MMGRPLYWNSTIQKAFKDKQTVKCALTSWPDQGSAEIAEFCPEMESIYQRIHCFLDVEAQKGRSHVLTLYHAIKRTIDAVCRNLVGDPVKQHVIENIVRQNLSFAPRLEMYLNYDRLCEQVWFNQFTLKQDSEYEIGQEMLTLDLLLRSASDLIWRDLYRMPLQERLNARMEYCLTSYDLTFYTPDLLIYKRSRGYNCDEEMAAAIPFLRDYLAGDINANEYFDLASVTRFLFWAEVRFDKSHLNKRCASIDWAAPVNFEDGYAIDPLMFRLLRSDYALKMCSDKFEKFVSGLESYLVKYLDDQELKYANGWIPPDVEQATLCYVCSLFLFGHYRLSKREGKIANKAISYLFDVQHKSGRWEGSEAIGFSNKTMTCMAIHALSMSKGTGWKLCCQLAAKWLRSNESRYFDVEGGTTEDIILLDSLDMANGSSELTFNPEFKPEIKPLIERKKIVAKKADKIDYSNWTVPRNVCFIIDNKQNVLFDFKGKQINLCIGHRSKAYKLLILFTDRDYLTIGDVKLYLCTDKTKPNHVVRDVNEAITNKLKSKIPGLPKEIDEWKYVAYNEKEKVYISVFSVRSIERYDRDYLKDNEKIVRDGENYRSDDDF